MKCKNCGCEFDEGIFCPECGTKFEEEIIVDNSKKCKKCGCVFDEGIFCPECGTKFKEENDLDNSTKETEEKAENNKQIVTPSETSTTVDNSKEKGTAGLIILLILSIIAFFLSFCFGVGALLAIPVLIIAVVMLIKKNKSKSLWVTLVISCITIFISLIVLIISISNAKKNAEKVWDDYKTFVNIGYEPEEEESNINSDEDIKIQESTNIQEDINKPDDNDKQDNAETLENTSDNIVIDYDAANYRDISEDELVAKLGCKKNEYGVYPSGDNPIFMCSDNYVRSIVIDNDDEFYFMDLKLGDSFFDNDYPIFEKEYRDYKIYGVDRQYEGSDGIVGIILEDLDDTKILTISWVSNELGLYSDYDESYDDAYGYNILYGKFRNDHVVIWDRELQQDVETDSVYTIEWYEDYDYNSQMIISTDWGLEYIGYFPGDYPFDPDDSGWWNVELTNYDGENLEVKIHIDVDKNEVSTIVIEDMDTYYSRNLAGEYNLVK